MGNRMLHQLKYTDRTKKTDILLFTQDNDSCYTEFEVFARSIGMYSVNNQEEFNDIIERVSSSVYKIKDNITHVRFKYISEGYLMYGIDSPLSDGDTVGDLHFNLCKHIYFEPGAFIDFGSTVGEIFIENESIVDNMWIKGDTSTTSLTEYVVRINSDNVTFNRCRVSSRSLGNDTNIFHCQSSIYYNVIFNNCIIEDIYAQLGSTTTAFNNCHNLYKCIIRDINDSNMFLFATAGSLIIEGCKIYNITVDFLVGWSGYMINNCFLRNINNVSGSLGIQAQLVNNCQIIGTGSSNSVGFNACGTITNCSAENCSTGIAECQIVINCRSHGNVINGFDVCKSMGHNLSYANGTANYTATCYADWAGTIPVADTAAGGWNG